MTVTAPWSLDTPQLVAAGGVLQTYQTATITTSTGAVVDTFDLERCQLAWDETRAPRVSAALTGPIPDSQALLDAIDPRKAARVVIATGYRLPNGHPDVHTLADLGLRRRPVVRPDDTLALSAQSDEAIVIDQAPANLTNLTGTPQALIRQLVDGCFAAPRTWTDTTVPAAAVTLEVVEDRWTTVNDLADQIGARVYDDGLRGWFIAPAEDTPRRASASLKVGPGGTITGSTTELTRDDFYNRVFLDYQWQDPATRANKRVISVRSVTSGPLAATAANTRTYYERRNTPTTQAAADAAATALLRRLATRGRSMDLEAPAYHWLRPGQTVTAQLPLGAQERHLIQAVTYTLDTGRMAVTTRLPDPSMTIGA